MQFKSIDKSDDPRYAEVIGRVYRLKSDFLVHAHVMDGGRGPTAYTYTMRPVTGPLFMGNRYKVFWGTIPAGTLIKIVEVREQPPYFNIGYVVEVLDANDERFDGLRIKVASQHPVKVNPPTYSESAHTGEAKQFNKHWFEEVLEIIE